jgi:hypothetical protein
MALAQLSEQAEAIAIRQAEVDHHEVDVGVLLDEPQRQVAVRRFQHDRIGLQFHKDTAQCLADEDVIVDHQNLHARPTGRLCADDRFVGMMHPQITHQYQTSV